MHFRTLTSSLSVNSLRAFVRDRRPGTTDPRRLGVALGRLGIAVVTVAVGTRGAPTVEGAVWLPWPAAGSDGNRGDLQPLRAALQPIVAARYPAHVLLAPSAYRMTLLDAPPGPEREHARSIRWSLAPYLSEPVDQMAIAVFPMAGPTQAGGARRRLAAISIRKTDLQRQRDRLLNLGFNLHSIGIPPLALRNISIHAVPAGVNNALLSISPDLVLFSVHCGDHLVLSRQWSARGASGRTRVVEDGSLAVELARSLDYCADRGFPVERLLTFAAPLDRDNAAQLREPGAAATVPAPEPLPLVGIPGIHWQAPAPSLPGQSEVTTGCLHALGAALRGTKASATGMEGTIA